MELKPGYKMTEVGVIPEDWEVKPLSYCVKDLRAGVSVNSTKNDSGVAYILKTSSVYNGKVDLTEIKPVCLSDIQRLKIPLESDCILISRMNTPELVGASGYSRSTYNNIFLPDRLWKTIKNTKTKTSFLWLSYLLNSQQFKIIIQDLGTGTSNSMKNITKEKMLSLVIPIPNFTEQTAIAAALSDVDALLASLDALIAKKRDMKQAAMQELLTGRRRLPGFGANKDETVYPQDQTSTNEVHRRILKPGYKMTEVGVIPEDWECLYLGDFTDCTAGGTPNTQIADYWGGQHPWMNSRDLHKKYVSSVDGRITDKGLNNSNTKYIPESSCLIGLAGQGKTRGTAALAKIKLCINQSIAAVFPSNKHNSAYLFHYLDSRYDELRLLSSGDGGRGGLNLTLIRKLAVALPPIPEQTAIAAVLSDMDAEIAALEARRAKTQDLKQGMMQELLTGRIRLRPAEGESHA